MITRSARSLSLIALSFAAVISIDGCAGPPIPSPIEGEPVCPDFEVGTARAKMVGSLKNPVRLRILDGKTVVMKITLPGLRSPTAPLARSLIADDNQEYTLEWAQCDNERAPRLASTNPKEKEGRDVTQYECGEAKVYKTDTLVTKKHDAASHVIHFAAPPNAACWTSELPPPAVPTASPDAGAPASSSSAAAVPSASATAGPAAETTKPKEK